MKGIGSLREPTDFRLRDGLTVLVHDFAGNRDAASHDLDIGKIAKTRERLVPGPKLT